MADLPSNLVRGEVAGLTRPTLAFSYQMVVVVVFTLYDFKSSRFTKIFFRPQQFKSTATQSIPVGSIYARL